jgi:glutathione S-transferase
LSVFRNVDAFSAINPLVKAPTFVLDDGTVLVESQLIVEYAEKVAGRSLMPADLHAFVRAQRAVGLALIACEKSVQIVYERNVRPTEKQHAPWLARVSGQLHAAYAALEAEFKAAPGAFAPTDQAGISSAVAWKFTEFTIGDVLDRSAYPILAAFSVQAEAVPEFSAAPCGLGTYSGK